jgi:hypothetical protein
MYFSKQVDSQQTAKKISFESKFNVTTNAYDTKVPYMLWGANLCLESSREIGTHHVTHS